VKHRGGPRVNGRAEAIERAALDDQGGHALSDLPERRVQIPPHARPFLHGLAFDEGVLDHVQDSEVSGMLLLELPSHPEIRERHMAEFVG